MSISLLSSKKDKVLGSIQDDLSKIINDYCTFQTKINWRDGSPCSPLIKEKVFQTGFCDFSWTNITLASFLIRYGMMNPSILNLNNEKDYQLWKSIIIYVDFYEDCRNLYI